VQIGREKEKLLTIERGQVGPIQRQELSKVKEYADGSFNR